MYKRLTDTVLPAFLVTRRWFAAKHQRLESIAINQHVIWKDQEEWLLARVQVKLAEGGTQTYSLPLALAWEKDGEEQPRAVWPDMLAKVRRRARIGLLCDAFTDETFCHTLVEAMGRHARIPVNGGVLKFSSTAAFASLAGDDSAQLPVRRLAVESSNTTLLFGERLFLKGYRRLQWGVNPELEMGRFLTDVSPFDHVVPLAGALEYEDATGAVATLALLQGYVANQGDAWNYTVDTLRWLLEDCALRPGEDTRTPLAPVYGEYLSRMRTLGQRTGELHCALAKTTGDPAFDPEPITPEDPPAWNRKVCADAAQTLERLARQQAHLPKAVQIQAEQLLAVRENALARIQALQPVTVAGLKTRYHGDYHLGQVLVAKNDFILVDFEGDPGRTLEERRQKHSPLRDVAGMLRSFNYAAWTALYQATNEQSATVAQLEPFARKWENQTREAFLAGYIEAVQGCPVYPQDPTAAQTLLDLFVLEKAFYELRYELANRPDWVPVPLGGGCTNCWQGIMADKT